MDRIPIHPAVPPAIYRHEGQPCEWLGQRADPPLRALAVGCILAAIIMLAVAI